ncbi:hypothetical protein CDL15_Pgr007399 [Punica granatum]|uniref:Uncharacterized protein n=1 Tax=Punica granatum TaxID=22663 RepID=A0A218XA18_PUNGR|nr:hypothetical protein CDL15_Pgr007399 [Punica granatum]
MRRQGELEEAESMQRKSKGDAGSRRGWDVWQLRGEEKKQGMGLLSVQHQGNRREAEEKADRVQPRKQQGMGASTS